MGKKNILIITLFSLLFCILFGSIMAHELKLYDFPQHIAWAKEYAQFGYIVRSNPLFHSLVVIIRALLPANILVRVSTLAKQVYDLKSFEISTWLLMVLSYLATGFILFKRFVKEWGGNQPNKVSFWMIGAATLIIMLVEPIFIFTAPERIYMGYISPNPYHNPTYLLMRPFALAAFFNVIDNLFSKWNWKQSVIMVILIACASLAKPSFTVTLIPAVGLLILFFYMRKLRTINWYYLIFPLGIGSLIMLGTQFLVSYGDKNGEQILIAPFKALLLYVPNVPLILIFGFLSILFPLLVSIFHLKENAHRPSFQLVWLTFFVSLAYDYLLYEIKDIYCNNFAWGAMFAVFLLFVETIIIFGRKILQKGFKASIKNWETALPGAILLLHFGCGIYYFICGFSTINIFAVL